MKVIIFFFIVAFTFGQVAHSSSADAPDLLKDLSNYKMLLTVPIYPLSPLADRALVYPAPQALTSPPTIYEFAKHAYLVRVMTVPDNWQGRHLCPSNKNSSLIYWTLNGQVPAPQSPCFQGSNITLITPLARHLSPLRLINFSAYELITIGVDHDLSADDIVIINRSKSNPAVMAACQKTGACVTTYEMKDETDLSFRATIVEALLREKGAWVAKFPSLTGVWSLTTPCSIGHMNANTPGFFGSLAAYDRNIAFGYEWNNLWGCSSYFRRLRQANLMADGHIACMIRMNEKGVKVSLPNPFANFFQRIKQLYETELVHWIRGFTQMPLRYQNMLHQEIPNAVSNSLYTLNDEAEFKNMAADLQKKGYHTEFFLREVGMHLSLLGAPSFTLQPAENESKVSGASMLYEMVAILKKMKKARNPRAVLLTHQKADPKNPWLSLYLSQIPLDDFIWHVCSR